MKLNIITKLSLIILICYCLSGCGDSDIIYQSLMDISGAPLEYDDSKANAHLNIASVSMQCSENKQENLNKMINIIKKIMAEKPQTRLIVFGETILGWYYKADEPEAYQRSVAETIPGPATLTIGVLADSLDIYIVFGMSEIKESKLYNSQVLLNPQGEIEAVHRKVNFIDWDEESGFTKGNQVTVVEIDGIKTGMIVCADVQSLWLTKALVEENIELLLHSLASNAGEFTIDAVARQFNSWVVFANRCGREDDADYSGTCYISDPAGTIRVGCEGEERYVYYRIGVYQ